MSGRLIIMGSGEIAPRLVATHRAGIEAAGADAVTILDTPFGFQENADVLSARLVEFFGTSLNIRADVASYRSAEESDLRREQMVAAVRRSRYVFAGPGSPSYALRAWRNTGLAAALEHVIASGGTVTFASAAALTVGTKTIPVYEIYKVGEAPHWLDGLGVTATLGLPVPVVPHWNNAEGGNHDTSRCFIGRRRLHSLSDELESGILGVDEHTAVTIDMAARVVAASGIGTVTLRGADDAVIRTGEALALDAVRDHLGTRVAPAPQTAVTDETVADFTSAVEERDPEALAAAVLAAEAAAAAGELGRGELKAMLLDLVGVARAGLGDPRGTVAPLVEALIDLRSAARDAGRYEDADAIRDRLAKAGIEVRDTPAGAEWDLLS